MKSNQEIIEQVLHDYPDERYFLSRLEYEDKLILDILMNRARADQSDSERKQRSVNQQAF